MTQNTTGIPMNVTKEPQCRHSEKQGFVSYDTASSQGRLYVFASCSNCGSEGDIVSAPSATADMEKLREEARNALMRVEAPPLVP